MSREYCVNAIGARHNAHLAEGGECPPTGTRKESSPCDNHAVEGERTHNLLETQQLYGKLLPCVAGLPRSSDSAEADTAGQRRASSRHSSSLEFTSNMRCSYPTHGSGHSYTYLSMASSIKARRCRRFQSLLRLCSLKLHWVLDSACTCGFTLNGLIIIIFILASFVCGLVRL